MADRRTRLAALTALLFTLPLPALTAQFAVGVGRTTPTSDYGKLSKPGWMVAAGYSPWRSHDGKFRLWLQGYYGENDAQDSHHPVGRKLLMTGAGLSIKPLPPTESPSPYLILATGRLNQWTGDTRQGAIYLGGGAGVSMGRHWVQARYQAAALDAGSLGFLLLAGGTSF